MWWQLHVIDFKLPLGRTTEMANIWLTDDKPISHLHRSQRHQQPWHPPAATILTYLESYTDHFHLRPHIQMRFHRLAKNVLMERLNSFCRFWLWTTNKPLQIRLTTGFSRMRVVKISLPTLSHRLPSVKQFILHPSSPSTNPKLTNRPRLSQSFTDSLQCNSEIPKLNLPSHSTFLQLPVDSSHPFHFSPIIFARLYHLP